MWVLARRGKISEQVERRLVHVILQNVTEAPATTEGRDIEREEDLWTMYGNHKALCRGRMGSKTGSLLMGLKMLEGRTPKPVHPRRSLSLNLELGW